MAASHLVAHDALRRGPDERAQMLRRIGVSKIIWDWRDEHLAAFETELDALRRHHVDLAGVWTPLPMPAYEEPDYASRFGVVPGAIKTLITEAARRGHSPDLWTQIGFGQPGAPAVMSPEVHAAEVSRAADHLSGLARLARGHGMCVVLTNHGGWAGEPRTLVDVVKELARRGLGNVGIGLRLQHAHHLIADLDHHLKVMNEHLVAVMLSGADAGAELTGRVILPFGAGSRDRWVTHALLESGWRGQLAIHAVGQDDSEARLLDSLDGWEWSVDRFLRHPRPRPTPRILEPTWPPREDWAGRAVAAARRDHAVGALAGVPAPAAAARAMSQLPAVAHAAPAAAAPDAPVQTPRVPTPYGQQAPPRQPARTASAAAYFHPPAATRQDVAPPAPASRPTPPTPSSSPVQADRPTSPALPPSRATAPTPPAPMPHRSARSLPPAPTSPP
ncbi:hypothetical protein LGT39_00465, partial [Demequina sp. TTPB684]|nr:hypothetical protein [Demequina sp. TTPB684]